MSQLLWQITATAIIWQKGEKLADDPGKCSISQTCRLHPQLLPPLCQAGRCGSEVATVSNGAAHPADTKWVETWVRNVLVRLQSPPTAANRTPRCISSAGQGVSQAGSQSLGWLQARGGRGKRREFDSEAGPGEYAKAQAVLLNSGLGWSLIKPIPVFQWRLPHQESCRRVAPLPVPKSNLDRTMKKMERTQSEGCFVWPA